MKKRMARFLVSPYFLERALHFQEGLTIRDCSITCDGYVALDVEDTTDTRLPLVEYPLPGLPVVTPVFRSQPEVVMELPEVRA